jgi:chemotaxis protein CheX
MKELVSSKTIVDIVHEVTGEVLSTMLSLETTPGEVYTEMQHGKSDGVVSFVGLAGSQCVGTGSLQCTSAVACSLAGRFLMSEFPHVDDEVLDAFGELTNMVVGNFKTALEGHVGQVGLSIPTVVHGKNFSTRSPGNAEWTVIPFLWGDDKLYIRVCLKAKNSDAAPVPLRKPYTAEQIRNTFSELVQDAAKTQERISWNS